MREGAPGGAETALMRGASAVIASGRYRLFASLGRGGMADVFLGVARGPMGFNKLVVVKKLREGLTDDESFVKMFLDEGRLAARLNHPNVIHTYEIGEFESTYFLAMEYLDGQSLASITKALLATEPAEEAGGPKKVEPALWVKIISDALSGLHHAHELRDYDGTPMEVIHRDVSPQNLFVTYDGVVKLVDFGIAKAALNSAQTETGVLKGKIAYMAPEQALGQPIDRRADLFPMGIVLWELMAGRRLITGDAAAALHKLLNEPIRPLVDVVPDFDPALDAIVMKALSKDPAQRYATALEMRDALEGYLRAKNAVITERQIGDLVSDLFKVRRDEAQKQIQQYMASLVDSLDSVDSSPRSNAPVSSAGAIVSLAAPLSLPSLASTSRSIPAHSHGRGHLRSDESDASAVKSAADGKGKRGMLTALALAAAVALFGVWLGLRTRDEPRAAGDSARSQDARAQANVSIAIVAVPSTATLYLDDKKLPGNPYVGTFSQDEREHLLRAEAAGYETTTRAVRFQNDGSYELALSLSPPPPPATSAPEKPANSPAQRTPKGATSSKGPATVPPLEQDPWK